MPSDKLTKFLPMTREEMDSRGWRELDVLLVTGDAYFDHPTHGAALIGRILERAGYRVGIIAQPDWRSLSDFTRLGRPALFAGVTAGAVDSMVNNYTASGAKRRRDEYSAGGSAGGRPDLATSVYANRLREAFPGLPIVLGGIEASVRRFAYVDFTKRKVRRSLLVDTRAEILVYGPGEYQALEIANRLAAGRNLNGISGTARLTRDKEDMAWDAVELPDFETVSADPVKLIAQALAVELSGRPFFTKRLYQRYAEGMVLCEPRRPVDQETFDGYFDLPFAYEQHPSYNEPIPALETVRWSVISHRGCPGGCSFCALAIHQGRGVERRSENSILDEVARLAKRGDFKGTITDIGGPTANAYGVKNKNQEACGSCRRPSCLFPQICKHLDTDHKRLAALLETASNIENVKRVFLASGIRHDLALKDPQFIQQVARNHTGGHLKVAPEHVHPEVLKRMRKPQIEAFEEFERLFRDASRTAGKKQYVVPYVMAAFPGCAPSHADTVGKWLAKRGQTLEQVQIFMPLTGTVAAAMQWARKDLNGEPLYIADASERKRQKSILTQTDIKKRN